MKHETRKTIEPSQLHPIIFKSNSMIFEEGTRLNFSEEGSMHHISQVWVYSECLKGSKGLHKFSANPFFSNGLLKLRVWVSTIVSSYFHFEICLISPAETEAFGKEQLMNM